MKVGQVQVQGHLTGVLLQPAQEAGLRQERELVVQGERVAAEPPSRLVEGQDLPGVRAAEAEELAEQRRLVDPERFEHIPFVLGVYWRGGEASRRGFSATFPKERAYWAFTRW